MPTTRGTNLNFARRREFLRGIGLLALAGVWGREGGKAIAMNESDGLTNQRPQIAGIDPRNVVEAAKARNLAALSDAGLYREVVAIVSRPPRRGGTSFTLHAPLEAAARYGLLRLVDPRDRDLARLQMITSAAVYQNGVDGMAPPAVHKRFPDEKTASTELAAAFGHGDADGVEAVVLQAAAQFGVARLVGLLTPLALPTLTGASHSHIGLWLLLRHGEPASADDASLLRAAARSLAADPKGRMKSFSGMSSFGSERLDRSPREIEDEILAKLASPDRGKLGSRSIRAVVEAGEATGDADRLFGDLVRHDLTSAQIDAAFRGLLRVSAQSMLQDDLEQAKYGWSHCLTLPQSACGLSSLSVDRRLALAASLVWITAYRSVLSTRALDFNWAPQPIKNASLHEALHDSPQAAAARVWHAQPTELADIELMLATQASIRNDLHLVKYTRACLDMGSFDPQHQRLYLAAAAHLCALWIKERPRATVLDHLLEGRTTPS